MMLISFKEKWEVLQEENLTVSREIRTLLEAEDPGYLDWIIFVSSSKYVLVKLELDGKAVEMIPAALYSMGHVVSLKRRPFLTKYDESDSIYVVNYFGDREPYTKLRLTAQLPPTVYLPDGSAVDVAESSCTLYFVRVERKVCFCEYVQGEVMD